MTVLYFAKGGDSSHYNSRQQRRLSCGVVSQPVGSVVAKFVLLFLTEHCVAKFDGKAGS